MLLECVLLYTVPVQGLIILNIIVQSSRHQYQHLVTIHHSLYPDSKTLLRSTWGKENIKMRDYYNPALRSAMMDAQDEAATKLDFFYSRNRVSLPNIPTLQNPNNQCSKLQIILVRRLLSLQDFSNIEISLSNNPDRQIS